MIFVDTKSGKHIYTEASNMNMLSVSMDICIIPDI